jgi:DNA-binding CsgD family transcriptional regulator
MGESGKRYGGDGASSGSRLDDDLRTAVAVFDLPLVLVDLDDETVSAASKSLLRHLDATAESLVGRSILEMVQPADRAGVAEALEALRVDKIDAYRARRHLIMGDGTASDPATAWVRTVDFGGHRLALGQISFVPDPHASPLGQYLGREPVRLAVGKASEQWVIESVSADIVDLLDITSDQAIGRRLIPDSGQREALDLLDPARWASEECSVSLRVRVEDGSGELRPLRCVLVPSAGPTNRWFMLLPEAEFVLDQSQDRTAQLEQHLWRIAAEVEASGVLHRYGKGIPDPTLVPQLKALSARQWEVLSHLMRGERVPTIAKEMFVSASTVRNHLSAIFQRFGVHSQAELLATIARETSA